MANDWATRVAGERRSRLALERIELAGAFRQAKQQREDLPAKIVQAEKLMAERRAIADKVMAELTLALVAVRELGAARSSAGLRMADLRKRLVATAPREHRWLSEQIHRQRLAGVETAEQEAALRAASDELVQLALEAEVDMDAVAAIAERLGMELA
jgi:hypothetical protein